MNVTLCMRADSSIQEKTLLLTYHSCLCALQLRSLSCKQRPEIYFVCPNFLVILGVYESRHRDMTQQLALLCLRALILTWLVAVPFTAMANLEGDALFAFRQQLNDPEEVLASWDNSLVNPCTWFHVTCNQDNNVVRVDLGNSSLSGTLVPELGNLASLEYLELFNNHFSGSIPPELGNLANLASLDLYQNALTGTIPLTLGKLKNLKYLRMDHNILTGEIPTELTFIASLLVVKLSYNNLTGVIPKFASTVSTFNLSFNNLTGVPPLFRSTISIDFQGNPYLLQSGPE